MKHFENKISSEIKYDGKFICLKRDVVELEDGRTSAREFVEHPGAVAVLAREGNCLIFVRQFRYAVGRELLELPAGKLERGENPETAALRELSEETGRKCEKLILLGSVFPSAGVLSEKIWLYYADELEDIGAHPDDGEFVSVEKIKIADLDNILIEDAKSLCAIYLAKTRGFID